MGEPDADIKIGSPEWWILARWIFLFVMGSQVFGLICWELASGIGTWFEDDVAVRPSETWFSNILAGLMALVFGLIFGVLSIICIPYKLFIYYLFPWFYGDWWPHIALISLAIAATWLPEGRKSGEKYFDAASTMVGYVMALVNPTSPMPDLPNPEELKQKTKNQDLSAQLQSELNKIERLKAKLKDNESDRLKRQVERQQEEIDRLRTELKEQQDG